MKIGINTLFFVPGDVGGTETYLRKNLLSLVADNPKIVFVLFTSKDNEAVLRADLARFSNTLFVQLPFRAARRPLRILFEQLVLPWYVWNSKIDVLWSPGYTAPILCSCPQAVTIHDLQYKTHPDDLSFLERKTLDFLVTSACRVCDAVVTVSEFSRQEVLRYDFAPPGKVFAILEGVDPALAAPPAAGTVNPVAQLTTGPYILCVAHTYPHKNVHVLIDAFALVADTIPHHLVLLGKARRGEVRVQESLAALPCKERIHRLSSLEFAELATVYQGADLFVLPSEYEGFGLPILEAMLTELPVITTDKASLPEVGGRHATYVRTSSPENFASAILAVIRMTAEEREARVQGGQAWAGSFTWQRSAAETLRLLQNLT